MIIPNWTNGGLDLEFGIVFLVEIRTLLCSLSPSWRCSSANFGFWWYLTALGGGMVFVVHGNDNFIPF